MHKECSVPSEVRKRLQRAGLGRAYAIRAAHELHDHWRDMVDEGMRAGMTQCEAETEATARLGSAELLAKEFASRMQRSSWLGRNPTFGFAMLALTLTIVWWFALGSLAANACGLFGGSIGAEDVTWRLGLFNRCLDGVRAGGYVVVPWLCCHVAHRFYCGWRPALWACLVIAIHNGMHVLRVSTSGQHGNISWGYSFNFAAMPALLALCAPLAVFALYQAWNRRAPSERTESAGVAC